MPAILPQEVGDLRVPFDPDFYVLRRIEMFKGLWPADPPSVVRTDPRVGGGKQLFRYDHRLYCKGSKRLPGGVLVPGMVMLTTDEHERTVEGDFQACLSDAHIAELVDHLDGQRTVTLDEYRADRAAKTMRIEELTRFGERVTTASDDEKFGRALSQVSDPDIREAMIAAYRRKNGMIKPGRPRGSKTRKKPAPTPEEDAAE